MFNWLNEVLVREVSLSIEDVSVLIWLEVLLAERGLVREVSLGIEDVSVLIFARCLTG